MKILRKGYRLSSAFFCNKKRRGLASIWPMDLLVSVVTGKIAKLSFSLQDLSTMILFLTIMLGQ